MMLPAPMKTTLKSSPLLPPTAGSLQMTVSVSRGPMSAKPGAHRYMRVGICAFCIDRGEKDDDALVHRLELGRIDGVRARASGLTWLVQKGRATEL